MDIIVKTKNDQSFTLQILPLRAFPKFVYIKIKNDKLGTDSHRYFQRISENSLDNIYQEIEMVEASKKE